MFCQGYCLVYMIFASSLAQNYGEDILRKIIKIKINHMKLKSYLFVFLLVCGLILVGCKDEIDQSDNEAYSGIVQEKPLASDLDSSETLVKPANNVAARRVGAGNFDKPQLLEVVEPEFKQSEPAVTREILPKKLFADISSTDLSFVEKIEIYNKPAYELINEGSFKTNVDRYFEENPDEFAEIDFVGSFKVSSLSYLLSWSKNDTTYKYIVSKGCMPHACGNQWGAMITSYNNIFDNYAVVGSNDQYDLYQFNREIPDDLLKILSFVYFERPNSIEDFKIN